MRVACIIITDGHRKALVDNAILPSVLPQGFDDVIVVGQHHEGAGYRYLCVPGLTHTTNDALVKRDVGTLATSADVLCYLCDDHALYPDFLDVLNQLCLANNWDVLAPSRWCIHPERGEIALNMGIQDGYLGGHAGVFRRSVIVRQPWTTMPHHPQWDVLSSVEHQANGVRYVYAPNLRVKDLEPERQPWR